MKAVNDPSTAAEAAPAIAASTEEGRPKVVSVVPDQSNGVEVGGEGSKQISGKGA